MTAESARITLHMLWSMTPETYDKAAWIDLGRRWSLGEASDMDSEALTLLEREPDIIDRIRDMATDAHCELIEIWNVTETAKKIREKRDRYSAVVAKLIARRDGR